MNLLKLQNHHHLTKPSRFSRTALPSLSSSFCTHRFPSLSSASPISLSCDFADSRNGHIRASTTQTPTWSSKEEESSEDSERYEYLAKDGEVFQNTLRLVETAMFAAVSGLAYLLSNSLAIENYFGCFFALPIVISSIRWGVVAGRKTMVATVVLLFVLSGPVKAVNYMLGAANARLTWFYHGFFMEVARELDAINLLVCTCSGNWCYRITINIHASLSYVLTSMGSNSIPTMNVIYTIFGTLLLINSAFFVLLLHILYAIFFAKFRMKASLRLPKWVDVAI